MSEKSEIVVNINPGGEQAQQTGSSTIQVIPGGGQVQQSGSTTMSQTMSSHTTSSGSTTSTTKTTKQVTKTVKTSSQTTVKKSTSGQKSISIQSSSNNFSDMFGKQSGIDVDAEMKKLMGSMQTTETSLARQSLMRLSSLEPASSGTDLIKLDQKSIMDYIDEADKDRLKFNFDVSGYSSQTVMVKSDGNKIEVHAKKSSKVGDEERSEEFSRTYEMPTEEALDPASITSSFFKDGVLSVGLPVNLALGQ